MDEKMPKTEDEPRVPVPEDFPEDATVSHPPGLSIEEQRRKLERESRMPNDEGLQKRQGGGLSDSTPVA